MTEVIVLGGGLVGRAIAIDLAGQGHSISVVDLDETRLEALKPFNIKTIHADIKDATFFESLLKKHTYFINALPGSLGFQILTQLIDAGKKIVDISFFPESPDELVEKCKDTNAIAVYDCGVAPGLSHILSGNISKELDTLDNLKIYVGGLPVIRRKPWEYKAVFSPSDIMEEYIRPAKLVRNGKIMTLPALSEHELIDFEHIGTLEAFNTDGLRSLINHIHCPNMVEKTLRYPGYHEKIKLLLDSGFFCQKEIMVNGKSITPLAVTSEILGKAWQMTPHDEDLTVMKVVGEGHKNGKKVTLVWELLDYADTEKNIHSMARTTGYTATAVFNLLIHKPDLFSGFVFPEFLGQKKEALEFVLDYLHDRNIRITRSEIISN